MLRQTILCLALLLSSTSLPFAAEYQGRDIDGQVYGATVFSYATGQYYNVSVEFDGDVIRDPTFAIKMNEPGTHIVRVGKKPPFLVVVK